MMAHSTLQLNQRICGGQAVVKAILSEHSFIMYHEEFKQEFMARKIADDEDISKWIDLQAHSNIVTAFDTFYEEITQSKYAMIELTNAGNMYQFIAKQDVELGICVSRDYRELIYDVAIQLATALDFAHNCGLVHGKFDLSCVVIDEEKGNNVFKI